MPKLIKRDPSNAADAALKFILVEPAEEVAPAGKASIGGKPAHLDTSAFVGRQLEAALATGSPVVRAKVPVDGEDLELPHDESDVLEDFVECVYVLHGWRAVDAISEELRQMYALMRVAAEPRPGGMAVPEETPPARSPASMHGRLPGGVLNAPLDGRMSELRWRIGPATLSQVEEWVSAFEKARRDLRMRVVRVARSFEQEALRLVKQRMARSEQVVLRATTEYYHFISDRSAKATLAAGLENPPAEPSGETTGRFRARLDVLKPLAQTVNDRNRDLIRFAVRHPRGRKEQLPEPARSEEKQVVAALEAAQAAYGSALAVASVEFPVLFRFDPDTLLETAEEKSDKALGRRLFERYANTFQAAREIAKELPRHQPAKRLADKDVLDGATPEVLIASARGANESIWAFPKLIELTAPRIAIEDSELAERVVTNVRAAIEAEAAADALLGTVKGIGLTGATIGLMVVCPPAGLALDVGLAAADITYSVDQYKRLSNAALCDLNPRESLVDAQPPAAQVVLAVAGAATVVL